MQKYLNDHPDRHGVFTPGEVAVLTAICDRIVNQLGLSDRNEIDAVAMRVLIIYEQGVTDPDRIVQIVVISIDKAKG